MCNAGIRVVTLIYTVQCEFVKARDPEREAEIKRENGGGLQRVSRELHWPDELCSLQKGDETHPKSWD